MQEEIDLHFNFGTPIVRKCEMPGTVLPQLLLLLLPLVLLLLHLLLAGGGLIWYRACLPGQWQN